MGDSERTPMANFEDLSWAGVRGCGKELEHCSLRMVGDKWFFGWAALGHSCKGGSGIEAGHVPKDFMPNPVHGNSS